jgi:hypothetical protein
MKGKSRLVEMAGRESDMDMYGPWKGKFYVVHTLPMSDFCIESQQLREEGNGDLPQAESTPSTWSRQVFVKDRRREPGEKGRPWGIQGGMTFTEGGWGPDTHAWHRPRNGDYSIRSAGWPTST